MEFNGLPLHALVVHAAVVFAPLAGAAAVAYLVPRWRDWLRWPLVVTAVLAGASVLLAYLSGQDHLDQNPALAQLPAVQTHQDRAVPLLWVSLGFAAVAVLTGAVHGRTGLLPRVLAVLVAVAGVGLLVLAFLTGEAGARAVWG